jgi:hypothetical protein
MRGGRAHRESTRLSRFVHRRTLGLLLAGRESAARARFVAKGVDPRNTTTSAYSPRNVRVHSLGSGTLSTGLGSEMPPSTGGLTRQQTWPVEGSDGAGEGERAPAKGASSHRDGPCRREMSRSERIHPEDDGRANGHRFGMPSFAVVGLRHASLACCGVPHRCATAQLRGKAP